MYAFCHLFKVREIVRGAVKFEENVRVITSFYYFKKNVFSGLIGFVCTFLFGTFISLVISQIAKSSPTQDAESDKPQSLGNFLVDPCLLHPIVNTVLCGCCNVSPATMGPEDYTYVVMSSS